MKKIITEEQKKFLIENYSSNGAKYCSQLLNLSISTISGAAFRLGLKVDNQVANRNKSKNIINLEDYFNVTDPKIAYILGLIWTDGHIVFSNNKSKTPVVKHSCVYYDAENSNKIFKSLKWRNFETNNSKSIGKNKMSINWISNRELGDFLIENNFKKKSLGTFIWKRFPNLINHFLRGLLDGDGCITLSSCNEKYTQSAVYFSSSHDQDWTYLTEILDLLDVKYKIRQVKDKLGKSSQVCIHESISIYKLCNFIYQNSEDMRLERKYQKFQDFLSYKKIYTKNNNLKLFLDGSISQIEQQ